MHYCVLGFKSSLKSHGNSRIIEYLNSFFTLFISNMCCFTTFPVIIIRVCLTIEHFIVTACLTMTTCIVTSTLTVHRSFTFRTKADVGRRIIHIIKL
ncbi:hypothetical protein X975_19967, partial [Stegodyphus mimosarum]